MKKVSELLNEGNSALLNKDYKLAISLFRKASKLGSYLAMYNIACMHYFGDGFLVNKRLAYKWFSLASENGDVEATNRLGELKEAGIGCLKDKQLALKLYKKAAKGGSLSAMYNLGKLYLENNIDNTKGLNWLKRAAELGNGKASLYLGNYYLAKKDIKKAYAYFVLGRKQKYSPALKCLIELKEKGYFTREIDVRKLKKELVELERDGY